MIQFNSLLQKIIHWERHSAKPLNIFGVTPEQWSFVFNELLQEHANQQLKNHHVIITPSNDEAEELFNLFNTNSFNQELEFLFYPSLEAPLYSGVFASEKNLYDRISVLGKLFSRANSQKRYIIVTSTEAMALRMPPRDFFTKYQITLKKDDIIAPIDLAKKLVELGYSHAASVEEPGTFVQKGQIFDIYPVGLDPIRLVYFDDLIENIYQIDENTHKTLKDKELMSVNLLPAAGIFSQNDFSITLRENIPQYGPSEKSRFEARKLIFSRLNDGNLFENYPSFIPLFFNKPESLRDYIDDQFIVTVLRSSDVERTYLETVEEMRFHYENDLENTASDNILPHFDKIFDWSYFKNLSDQKAIFVDQLNLNIDFGDLDNSIDLSLVKTKTFLNQHINQALNKPDFIMETLKFIKEYFEFSGQIFFSNYSEASKNEIKHLLEINEFSADLMKRIEFLPFKFAEGFYYESEKIIIISDGDLFTAKRVRKEKSKKVDLDLFAEQLATLKIGDYVIHNEYGVAEYMGLESLEIAGDQSDFLILKYADNDKIYVPVYKLNQIQKHADAAAKLKSDSLRNNKFAALKARARTSAKALAFDLLKLQAERQMSSAYAFNPPGQMYREFELAFPYEETPDQARAIEEVLESMQKPVPMDFLVCGDVGFGKTEVAMRAAFKAVEDKKQVAVLVPTTILALQHFNSFVKRYKDFPITIEFISRFKSPKETNEILEKVKEGKVDILIGTHKLLSDKLQFLDLGLVIVDEEQRFGVGHKEKLKLMKSSVDFLTLTATPIPRTLQMAFLGLRDLSLIKTPPPRRQSIKSYVIKEDELTIQQAIQKELQRGGQVFIVHNKVNDIEQYVGSIRELVPEANITFAHGQMGEKELEEKINAFYNGRHQVLVATTIIESGIDIPNANTMIIDRADTYGLSQLHQLRGRIGRSDKKAYAYFVVPRMKIISEVAQKRLHALQTYAEVGSGFNIASVDLEIRGAGDILGATQSGHIEAVGLELYMDLLKEAIHELRGEKKILKKDTEIVTPFAAYIPNHFIKDSSERLKQYKRLSNCESMEQLELMRDELQDIYGLFNQELSNLFTILETRIHIQSLGLKSLQVAGNSIILKFDKQFLENDAALRDNVVGFFISRPKIYQFTPDYKVIFNSRYPITQTELLNFAKEITKNLMPNP